ncbi:hypothetical protein A176_003866 [Myxococcus hansupus]|uniref:Uncharacterized protein n=1 Tax=Pseudomyxococcus hansupus TaxID=1297742 RepID=A0A0H4WVV5_9BACT|nr:hypothetical protein A176_003866 [Myxococcus hansupus]
MNVEVTASLGLRSAIRGLFVGEEDEEAARQSPPLYGGDLKP